MASLYLANIRPSSLGLYQGPINLIFFSWKKIYWVLSKYMIWIMNFNFNTSFLFQVSTEFNNKKQSVLEVHSKVFNIASHLHRIELRHWQWKLMLECPKLWIFKVKIWISCQKYYLHCHKKGSAFTICFLSWCFSIHCNDLLIQVRFS